MRDLELGASSTRNICSATATFAVNDTLSHKFFSEATDNVFTSEPVRVECILLAAEDVRRERGEQSAGSEHLLSGALGAAAAGGVSLVSVLLWSKPHASNN
jgi:hypothetical protein